MQPSPPQSSTRVSRLSFWFGAAALAFALFVVITHEMMEQEVSSLDRTILIAFANLRTPWLTAMAVDITALGSNTLVVLISIVALCVLFLSKDRMGALQLLAASAGAQLLTHATKDFIDRARPEDVGQLVHASGFSYPSGHALAAASLYLTLAILAGRHLETIGRQWAILAMTVVIILLVGTSRVYLGVHYPSDVAGGISLGIAWALLLAGCFPLIGTRVRS
jgi:undecaprenyl-diphosphatase